MNFLNSADANSAHTTLAVVESRNPGVAIGLFTSGNDNSTSAITCRQMTFRSVNTSTD
jgi:hypothetical protein